MWFVIICKYFEIRPCMKVKVACQVLRTQIGAWWFLRPKKPTISLRVGFIPKKWTNIRQQNANKCVWWVVSWWRESDFLILKEIGQADLWFEDFWSILVLSAICPTVECQVSREARTSGQGLGFPPHLQFHRWFPRCCYFVPSAACRGLSQAEQCAINSTFSNCSDLFPDPMLSYSGPLLSSNLPILKRFIFCSHLQLTPLVKYLYRHNGERMTVHFIGLQ